ncbi:hypothetical protein AB1Y20_003897 [Prymnesium parvum]|uniref:Uncharacterized protein n=1 Tax=Prymnesium parvum TaxID=97485 RepID=A0AB34J682_PRYPA
MSSLKENTTATKLALLAMTHSLSIASGVAISRLLERPISELAIRVAILVERARVGLVMGPSEMTAAMMFAQPLIKAWPEQWMFAYLIGVDLGMKYLHDGFFICDIINFVNDFFSLMQLKEGERQALSMVDWSNIQQRFLLFRKELASLAMEFPLGVGVPVSGRLPLNLVPAEDHSNLHVLVVSGAETICESCKAVRAANPDAIISSSNSLPDAVQLTHQYYHAGTRVNLICIDSGLLLQSVHTTEELGSAETFARSQRFCQQLEPNAKLKCFAYKPFIAAISATVEEVAFHPSTEGGSVCDCIIPAGKTSLLLPTLMNICEP